MSLSGEWVPPKSSLFQEEKVIVSRSLFGWFPAVDCNKCLLFFSSPSFTQSFSISSSSSSFFMSLLYLCIIEILSFVSFYSLLLLLCTHSLFSLSSLTSFLFLIFCSSKKELTQSVSFFSFPYVTQTAKSISKPSTLTSNGFQESGESQEREGQTIPKEWKRYLLLIIFVIIFFLGLDDYYLLQDQPTDYRKFKPDFHSRDHYYLNW